MFPCFTSSPGPGTGHQGCRRGCGNLGGAEGVGGVPRVSQVTMAFQKMFQLVHDLDDFRKPDISINIALTWMMMIRGSPILGNHHSHTD